MTHGRSLDRLVVVPDRHSASTRKFFGWFSIKAGDDPAFGSETEGVAPVAELDKASHF